MIRTKCVRRVPRVKKQLLLTVGFWAACRVLWSQPIPLAWYFGPQWARVYGDQWASRVCNRWIENDRNLKHFAGEVGGSGSGPRRPAGAIRRDSGGLSAAQA